MTGIAEDLFCAVSTPSGTSGIAVIRISGRGSAEAIDKIAKIIRSSGNYPKVSDLPGYTCCFADLRDPDSGTTIDKVIITRFTAPYSYTGDDMIEISCHGSAEVKRQILNALHSLGIRGAGPGEFTKTAFMNGKMSLSSAEAVMDVINADSAEGLRAANIIAAGGLADKLDSIEDSLYDMMARIEMDVDFDDDESSAKGTAEEVGAALDSAIAKLRDLTSTFRQGRMLTEKLRASFTGIPNSGKSTLLNMIAGYERSIVTDISGTTTDTIEVVTEVCGIPVILTDTAGIRRTNDRIEALGVERARNEYVRSDIIFYLVSPDTTVQEAKEQIHDIMSMAPSHAETVVLFNKSDLGVNPDEAKIRDIASGYGVAGFIPISAAKGDNVDKVRQAIKDHYDRSGSGMGGVVLTARRHYDALSGALARLKEAREALDAQAGLDVVSSIARAALDLTGEISGKTVSADLAKTIFDRFCIGK